MSFLIDEHPSQLQRQMEETRISVEETLAYFNFLDLLIIDEHPSQLQRQIEETRIFIEEILVYIDQVKKEIQRQIEETRIFEETLVIDNLRREASAMVRDVQAHHQNRADAYSFTPELFEEFLETGVNLKGSECVNWKKEGF